MKCDKCGSKKNVKSGLNITRSGTHQRYKCKTCGHVFTVKNIQVENQCAGCCNYSTDWCQWIDNEEITYDNFFKVLRYEGLKTDCPGQFVQCHKGTGKKVMASARAEIISFIKKM